MRSSLSRYREFPLLVGPDFSGGATYRTSLMVVLRDKVYSHCLLVSTKGCETSSERTPDVRVDHRHAPSTSHGLDPLRVPDYSSEHSFTWANIT